MDRCPVRGNQSQFLVFDKLIYPTTGNMMDRCPVRCNQGQFLVLDIVDLSYYR